MSPGAHSASFCDWRYFVATYAFAPARISVGERAVRFAGLTCLRSMPNTLSTVAVSAGRITASSPRTSHCTGAPGFKRNAAQISGGTMVNFFADAVAGMVTAPGAVRNNCIAAYGSSKPRGHFRRASSSEPHQERLSWTWCTRPHRHLRLVDSALPRPAINGGGIVVVQHVMVN